MEERLRAQNERKFPEPSPIDGMEWLTDGVLHIPSIINKEGCERILEDWEHLLKCGFGIARDRIGNDQHMAEDSQLFSMFSLPSECGVDSEMIRLGPMTGEVNKAVQLATLHYSSKYKYLRQMPLALVEGKFQKTKQSEGYHVWHIEQTPKYECNRVLTWILYLNDVEEGGETELLYQKKRVKAKAGDLIMFPCTFEYVHRGNPPLSGDKYIYTGWIELPS